jgi:hypothetical protein
MKKTSVFECIRLMQKSLTYSNKYCSNTCGTTGKRRHTMITYDCVRQRSQTGYLNMKIVWER